MKDVCDKYGALLILDEVMCGMGRCGFLHSWLDEGICPDIQTIGKGLGGGYAPVAGMLVGKRVIDVLSKGTGAFAHGQTYQGHPVACAAALAVNKIIREPGMMDQVQNLGRQLEEILKSKLTDHPHVGDIRGKGLFWGVRLFYLILVEILLTVLRSSSSKTSKQKNHSIRNYKLQCLYTIWEWRALTTFPSTPEAALLTANLGTTSWLLHPIIPNQRRLALLARGQRT